MRRNLLYLLSCNPVDLLALPAADVERSDGRIVVAFSRQKTGREVRIWEPLGGDLDRTVAWWESLRRERYPLTPNLIASPVQTKGLRRGRPLSRTWLSLQWRAACEALGYNYQLRMVRPRALSDEAMAAGSPTAKGGHASEAMKAYYVRVPLEAQNTLVRVREFSQ